jgi:TfoX/Sxy family transcriptional regulator of competence genes
MGTDPNFAAYVGEQLSEAGDVVVRRMFGEYGVFLGGKMVALVCDDQLFVRPTTAGRALLGSVEEAPPYPGARPHFLIGDELDDRGRMAELLRQTERELPAPRPRRARAKKRGAA